MTETMDVSVAINDLCVSSLYPPKVILRNISANLRKGSITSGYDFILVLLTTSQLIAFCAVLGSSGAGKSLLLRCISSQIFSLHITGEVFVNGEVVNDKLCVPGIAYVNVKESALVDELTPRENLRFSMKLKLSDVPHDAVETRIEDMLDKFNLLSCANHQLKYLIQPHKSLSMDQNIRLCICNALLSRPSVLLLDDPTVGLDSTLSYNMLHTIEQIVNESNRNLTVILSIHQPSTRILELMDNILLLGKGTMQFYGTLSELSKYIDMLGFSVPKGYTPVDFFLQLSHGTNDKWSSSTGIDFESSYINSYLGKNMKSKVIQYSMECNLLSKSKDNHKEAALFFTDKKSNQISDTLYLENTNKNEKIIMRSVILYFRKIWILFQRNLLIAIRAPIYYWLQFTLSTIFGVLTGLPFFSLKFEISNNIYDLLGGIVYTCGVAIYITMYGAPFYKIASVRHKRENPYSMSGSVAYWLADSMSAAILLSSYLPGTVITFVLFKYPLSALPFHLLALWMVRWV